MTVRRKWPAIAGFLACLGLLALAAFFVHELGHAFTAVALGGQFYRLYVWPGIELWPELGQPYPQEWAGNIGLTSMEFADHWGEWQRGLVYLMGSGSNMLLAAAALAALWIFKPAGLLRSVLFAETIMFIDLPMYTFLPLVGLRHYIFAGGETPEPLDGAVRMGIPGWAFVLAVGLVTLLMLWGQYRFLRRYPLWGGKTGD
jgi:hypothetical protein